MQIKTPLKPVVIDTPFTGPITPNIILGDAGEGNVQGTIMDANATMTAIKKAIEESGGGGGTTDCGSPFKIAEVTAKELESRGVDSENANALSNQINNAYGNYSLDTTTPKMGYAVSFNPGMSFMEAAVLQALDIWDESKFSSNTGITMYCAKNTAGNYQYNFFTSTECYTIHGIVPNDLYDARRKFLLSYYNGSSTGNKHTFAFGNEGAKFECKISTPMLQVSPFEITDSTKKSSYNVFRPTIFPRLSTIGEVNNSINSVVINTTKYNGSEVPGIEILDTLGKRVIGFYAAAAGRPVIEFNHLGKDYTFDFEKAISLGLITEA